MQIQASPDLLISQWRSAPKFYEMVRATIAIIQEDVGDNIDAIAKQWDVDQAEGVWLDFLGLRVGITRPLVEDPESDKRFGWKGPVQSLSFDNAPFRGILQENRYPLSDRIFRRFVKARGVLDVSQGDFTSFQRAAKFIDPESVVTDNRNMTVTIQTDISEEFELGDKIGALPRTAGVRIIYAAGPHFGFDDHGESFDQAVYE